MTTYTLTLTDHVARAQMTVTVQAASYKQAVDVAWRRYCKGSQGQAVVA